MRHQAQIMGTYQVQSLNKISKLCSGGNVKVIYVFTVNKYILNIQFVASFSKAVQALTHKTCAAP